MSLKDKIFHAANAVGLLSYYGRRKVAGTLTVVAFHRVLPRQDPRWPGADPLWTVSTKFFADCLDFFQRNYSIVSAKTVLEAVAGKTVLPDRALLITFDDGWADTAEFAAPELARRDLPSLLFVATGAIGQRMAFWQERIVSADRTGRLTSEIISSMSHVANLPIDVFTGTALIDALKAVPAIMRERSLKLLPSEPDDIPDQMMSHKAIAALPATGMAVGGHGVSHEPIPECMDPPAELAACFSGLAELLGAEATPVLSFPHGRYGPTDVMSAKASGFSVLFTSDRGLNACADRPLASVLARVEITPMVSHDGRLDTSRMARWVFGQPVLDLMDQE